MAKEKTKNPYETEDVRKLIQEYWESIESETEADGFFEVEPQKRRRA